MIKFYCHEDGFNQVEFGNMVIYYSFKMPFAYRTKTSKLKIEEDAFNGKWGYKTSKFVNLLLLSNSSYILSEKEVFNFNIDDQFKREILQMAKNITKKGFGLC